MSHFNERLPVPVKSAFQSNITGWSSQNLSKRDLKLLTDIEIASVCFFVVSRVPVLVTLCHVVWCQGCWSDAADWEKDISWPVTDLPWFQPVHSQVGSTDADHWLHPRSDSACWADAEGVQQAVQWRGSLCFLTFIDLLTSSSVVVPVRKNKAVNKK